MRGLKYAVPQNVKDSLNASPTFQWFITVLFVAGGILLVIKGVNGFKNKRITGKYGREYEGTTAQLISVAWIAIGALLPVIALGMQLVAVFTR
ncbi:MAG TPA: hypothetical protein VFI31_16830 [Pirellulales bacterium]|nr:hypothetical protein [Pirellulales bacterium]